MNMSWGKSLTLCALTLASVASCAWFQPPPPPAPLPVRVARTELPVLELSTSESLVGRCLNYRPEGTYRAEPCPPGVSEMMGPIGKQKFDSGQHETELLWIQAGPDAPPGFGGEGGYYHASESQIFEVHFAQIGRAKPKPEALNQLDSLCQQTGFKNDRAVIERAFGGCAISFRGVASSGATPPQVFADDLVHSNDRWGRPQHFFARLPEPGDGDTAKPVEPPACQGDLTAVKLRVVRLTDLCQSFVRQWVLDDLLTKTRDLKAKLAEATLRLEQAEQALDQARATAALARPDESDSKKTRADKRAERKNQKSNDDAAKAAAQLTTLRDQASQARNEREALEADLKALQPRLALYRDDPYLLRPGKTNNGSTTTELERKGDSPGSPVSATP